MKKIFFWLIATGLGMLPTIAHAQKEGQAAIDSMLAQLALSKEDTSKVLLLDDLADAYYFVSLEEGLKYEKEALALARKLNWKKGIAWATRGMGTYHLFKAEYNTAVDYFQQSLKLFESLGFQKGEGSALICIGEAYIYQADYPKALDYCFRALKVYEDMKDKRNCARVYLSMGRIYYVQNNYQKAEESYTNALKIYEELGNKVGIANALNGFGEFKPASERLEYYLKALKIYEDLGDKSRIASSYNLIAYNYFELKKYATAINYYLRSLASFREMEMYHSTHPNLNGIGAAYLFMVVDTASSDLNELFGGDKTAALQKSVTYLDSAITIAEEVNDLWLLSISYDYRSRAANLLGDAKNALKYLQYYVNVKDSIYGNEKARSITEMQLKYDQDKKDLVAEQMLKRQKMIRNTGLGGLAVTLVFFAFVFRQRNRISKEKKRSDELLLNILPQEVAEELKTKGSSDARQFEEVTVMFTDIKNFSQITEKLSPSELVAEIDACFKAFDNIIGKHNVEKIKTIGDSYMCAGGLPDANKTNALDVVSAAKEIQLFMRQYSAQQKKEGKEIFEIRIGIHTGPVVAGIVGVKKFAYDIWGDTVNIASRMESSGEPGKINISGHTFGLVKDKFNCVYRGKIQAKNKGEIDMYFVEG